MRTMIKIIRKDVTPPTTPLLLDVLAPVSPVDRNDKK